MKVRIYDREIFVFSSSSSPSAALSRLEDLETRCPADKAAVLVATHKNLVGMSVLLESDVRRC